MIAQQQEKLELYTKGRAEMTTLRMSDPNLIPSDELLIQLEETESADQAPDDSASEPETSITNMSYDDFYANTTYDLYANFQDMDKNFDNKVNKYELKLYMENIVVVERTDDEIEAMMSMADTITVDGEIDEEEFLALLNSL